MAPELPDCQNIPPNTVYSCTDPFPQCLSPERFDFPIIWNYTSSIFAACATDPRLYLPKSTPQLALAANNISLTQAACIDVAGAGWKRYHRSDIWTRLTTWKFPLFQLAFNFPRAPLSFWTEAFVVVHLMGDPVDTVACLLDKLAVCQAWAEFWKGVVAEEDGDGQAERLNEEGPGDREDADRREAEPILPAGLGNEGQNEDGPIYDEAPNVERPVHWRELTLIVDSYAEWEKDVNAAMLLHSRRFQIKSNSALRFKIHQTAEALAADRATKTLPVAAAQAFYIGTMVVALLRTADVANKRARSLNKTVFPNVEAFSIAFGFLYMWIIPTVILGALIGVSQTENAIPRILRRFQNSLEDERLLEDGQDEDPRHDEDPRNDEEPAQDVRIDREGETALTSLLDPRTRNQKDTEMRLYHGGIYSWIPSNHTSQRQSNKRRQQRLFHHTEMQNYFDPDSTRKSTLQHRLVAHIIVLAGWVIAFWLTSTATTGPFNCRHIAQASIVSVWIASAFLDSVLNKCLPLDEEPHYLNLNLNLPYLHKFKSSFSNPALLFWTTFVKDLVAALVALLGIALTTYGVLHRCECYSNWGWRGVSLPQMPDNEDMLRRKINGLFPAITFVGLAFELLLVPGAVWWRYAGAFEVYTQRDDEEGVVWGWGMRVSGWRMMMGRWGKGIWEIASEGWGKVRDLVGPWVGLKARRQGTWRQVAEEGRGGLELQTFMPRRRPTFPRPSSSQTSPVAEGSKSAG